MLKDKVGIDKSRLADKLRDLAYELDQDYWGNLFRVLRELASEMRRINDKLKILYNHINEKEVAQYGKLMDAEETFEKSDNFKKKSNDC